MPHDGVDKHRRELVPRPSRGGDARAAQETGRTRPPEGRVLEADEVALRVVRAVRGGELYIHTHEESREFIRHRFDRIDRAFDA